MLMSGSSASTCASTFLRRQPNQRGHRNTVPAGHHRPAVSPAISGVVHSTGAALPHSNTVPSIQMQCRMTASFLATATCAFFMPTLLANRTPHAFSAHQRFVRWSSTAAAVS